MDLGRAIVTSVLLGAAAYILPRLAYLALEQQKIEANTVAMNAFLNNGPQKPEIEPRPFRTVAPYSSASQESDPSTGMYM